MMSDYIISCCSTADLEKEHFEKRDIHYICFHFELDGKQYRDDLGQSIPFDEFYRRMQEGASTRTSQINVEEFREYFEPFLKAGKDILHVTLSSGISGVFNSAKLAADELMEQYPDAKPMLFVLSDGDTNTGYGLNDIRDVLSGMKIPVYTIGYNADLAALESISAVNEAASIDASTDDVVYQLKILFNASM